MPRDGSNWFSELLGLFSDVRAEGAHLTTTLVAHVKRFLLVALSAAAVAAFFFAIGLALGSPGLLGLSLFALGLVISATLIVLWPIGVPLSKAVQEFPALRNWLRLAIGALLWFFLSALFLMALPKGSGLLLVGPVLGALAVGALFLAGYGIGPDPRRMRAIALLILLKTFAIGTVTLYLPRTTTAAQSTIGVFDGWLSALFLRRVQISSVEELDTVRFFDGNGNPLVWFAMNAGGRPEFFDRDGYHPQTRSKLLPVTEQAVVAERLRLLRDAAAAREETKQFFASSEKQEASRRADSARVAREEKQRDLARLANSLGAERMDLAVALVGSKSASSGNAAGRLVRALAEGQKDFAVSDNAFAPEFVSGGYLRQVLDGHEPRLLDEIGVFAHVRAVLLGEVNRSCTGSADRDGVWSCDVALRFKTFGPSGRVLDAGEIETRGAGFTQAQAYDRAVEQLGERNPGRLLRPLATAR